MTDINEIPKANVISSLEEVTLEFEKAPPVRALSLVLFVGDFAIQEYKVKNVNTFTWKLPKGVKKGDELRIGWTTVKKDSKPLGENLSDGKKLNDAKTTSEDH